MSQKKRIDFCQSSFSCNRGRVSSVVRLSSYRYFLERTMEMKRMKKPLAWLLSALMLFTALPVTAFADEVAPVVTASVNTTSKTTPTAEPVLRQNWNRVPPNGCSVGGSHGGTCSGFGTEFRPYGRANGSTHRGTCSRDGTGNRVPSRPPRRFVTPTEKPAPEVEAEPSSALTAAPTTVPTATTEAVPVEDPHVPGFTVIESEIGGAHAWPVPDNLQLRRAAATSMRRLTLPQIPAHRSSPRTTA